MAHEPKGQLVEELESSAVGVAGQQPPADTNLLNAIARAQHQFIVDQETREPFHGLLATLLEATESEYGFIGEVHTTSGGDPYLKTHAITNIAWDEETRGFHDRSMPNGMEFHNQHSLFGAVLTGREPVIANEPGTDPRRCGLPEGHPPLNAFLGVPFFDGKKMIGMAGVANRLGGYTEEQVAILQPLLHTFSLLIQSGREQKQRKRVEQALLESEQQYRELVEGTENLVTQVDVEGRFTFLNHMCQKFLGVSSEEGVGLLAFDFIHPDDRERTENAFDRWLRDRSSSLSFENRQVSKDGQTYEFLWTISARFADTGDVVGFNGIARDITQHKQAERALRESENRFRTFCDTTFEAVVIHDQGKIVDANVQFSKMFGVEPQELIGMNGMDFVAPEDRDLVLARIRVGEQLPYEHRGRHKNGSLLFLEARGGSVCYEGRDLRCTVLRDITDRKNLEEQLLQAQKMESVGTLAGGVAHEINNVLAVVLGLGSVVASEAAPNDPKRQDIQEIVSAARRGKSVVENLLGFARKGSYQSQRVALNDTVRGAVAMLARTLPKKLVFNTSLDDQLEATECDSAQITQALVNLCLNAVDAVDGAGTVTISTSNEDLAGDVVALEPGRYVQLQVKDNGPGMDEETRKRAFEPFFTTKEVGKGSGLGLSMVYGVMQNHGGAAAIQSVRGEGTTVTLWLPAVGPIRNQEKTLAPECHLQGGTGKILVVDDEEMIRVTLKGMLESCGYEVLVADGGPSALEIFRDRGEMIDLVLLDLSMPIMDGEQCFQQLRQINPGVPVLICTGHGSDQTTDQMISKGASGVVKKPFDLAQLSAAVVRVI